MSSEVMDAPGGAHAEHHPALAHHFRNMVQQKESATLGMWVFIVQEIMFFGGLFGAYTVYRFKYFESFAAGSHHLNVPLGAVNTAVLICSSLTMALAVHAAALGRRQATAAFLVATILLGGVFLGVKTVEYHDKFVAHLVPGEHYDSSELKAPHGGGPLAPDVARSTQIFFSLYFAMTGLHALHMIIGIPIIAWFAWRAWKGHYGPGYYTPVEMLGLYWHFVDIIWIFLFPLLYLIPHHA